MRFSAGCRPMPTPSFRAAHWRGSKLRAWTRRRCRWWKSPLLRYGPHALRSGLRAELRLTLVTFLTELKRSQPEIYDLLETHRGGGLAEVRADDYAMAIDRVRSLTREGAER